MRTLELALQNLNADVAVLRAYVQTGQDAGLQNMLNLLETLAIPLFFYADGYQLVSKELLNPNFPAIDLSDDGRKVAAQVTFKADAEKIRYTINKYNELNASRLKKKEDAYTRLVIFSLLPITTNIDFSNSCELVSFKELAIKVKGKNSIAVVEGITNALRQHVDYSRLHPYTDIACLEIILGCVDRNAIKHKMHQEGSHSRIVVGLNEISEIISKGTVNGVEKCKDIDRFSDPSLRKYLTKIRNEAGKIVAIANENKRDDDFVFIPIEQYEKINKLKAGILLAANNAAKHAKLGITYEAC